MNSTANEYHPLISKFDNLYFICQYCHFTISHDAENMSLDARIYVFEVSD